MSPTEWAQSGIKVKRLFIYKKFIMQVSWTISTKHQYQDTVSSQKMSWYMHPHPPHPPSFIWNSSFRNVD